MKIKLLICLIPFVAIGSAQTVAQDNPVTYSFFVAGHTYGAPGVDNHGLHPPFVAKFPYIKSRPEIALGFLTGDIVKESTEQDWDDVDNDIDSLGLPVYFAVGNHDMKNRELFESRYGRTYSFFQVNGDLYIILDPNIDHWNISGQQLIFLRAVLNEYASQFHNIFVFFHQLLWWSKDNKYADLKCNSLYDRAEEINFWSEVEPMFHQLDNPVFMFAGDVGATATATAVAYDQYDNITLIASGMGRGSTDNFVIVNIHENHAVSYDLICLNSNELNCMGKLEDHGLADAIETFELNENIVLFPNPVDQILHIDHPYQSNSKIEMLNLNGVKVKEAQLEGTQSILEVGHLPAGFYLIRIYLKNEVVCRKVLIR